VPQALPEPAVLASSSSGAPEKTPTRCAHPECKKKVGLTAFKCKCEHVFCGAHRLAEDHSCPFDFKTMQRQQLAAANPVIQASKVKKL
jgi:predicted nucleic acid binding AN1-type Zn finger protein